MSGIMFLRRDNDSLRAGRSGERTPVRARLSETVQAGPGLHPPSYTMGTGPFAGIMRRGVALTTHPTPKAEVEERIELYVTSTHPLLCLHGRLQGELHVVTFTAFILWTKTNQLFRFNK
jgi:hypothetical protein